MQKILMRLVMKYHKVMRLVMKSHMFLTNSNALLVQQRAERRYDSTIKVIHLWGSQGQVIHAVLLHCASSEANDFQKEQWLQLNCKDTSQQITVIFKIKVQITLKGCRNLRRNRVQDFLVKLV